MRIVSTLQAQLDHRFFPVHKNVEKSLFLGHAPFKITVYDDLVGREIRNSLPGDSTSLLFLIPETEKPSAFADGFSHFPGSCQIPVYFSRGGISPPPGRETRPLQMGISMRLLAPALAGVFVGFLEISQFLVAPLQKGQRLLREHAFHTAQLPCCRRKGAGGHMGSAPE